MPDQPKDMSGEDDMSPIPSDKPQETNTHTDEPDDSPLDIGKGNSNINGSLTSLGCGQPYKSSN